MKLTEINALRGMTRHELQGRAEAVGVRRARWVHTTDDALRLAIIDAICDRELAEQP